MTEINDVEGRVMVMAAAQDGDEGGHEDEGHTQ
jgi:hypothetical protein